MAEDSGGSLAAVEIVTHNYAVIGHCRGISDYIRLIDLLNNPDVTHLQLDGIKVRELLRSLEVLAADGPLVIDKSNIVFGRSLESAQVEAKRRETHRADYVEKAKYQLLVFAAPFRILGNAYLFRGADLRVALPRLVEGFLAITEAKIVHEDNDDLAWEGDFIVVNGKRIEMVCSLASPEPPAEEPQAEEATAVDEWDPEEISDLLQPK